ncbi:MAG TPA: AMP-binding protein [Ramlibacter sp.]|nr:AMP-binding protein [Ramlibacter sp.]
MGRLALIAMHALETSPLLAAPDWLDKTAIVAVDRAWTWRDVHAQSIELAARLEPGTAICNLCNSRLAFLVTMLAALRRGCAQVLPPSAGPLELSSLLRGHQVATVVVDDEAGESMWAGHPGCLRFTPASRARSSSGASIEAWLPQWNAPSTVLYTSGSTGTPEPHPKTLAQLARGAQVLAARIDEEVSGGVASLGRIVCSVAPQHMFGLEASVMFPLIAGTPVCEARPLLPADVAALFAQAHDGAAWVATPLHLRAFAQADMELPHCRMVLASTMPMSQGLADQAERFSQSPVLEIYGSTETGVLAMRRTARDETWRPVDGVALQAQADGTLVRGSHFSSPLQLADVVEPGAHGVFSLRGRRGDIIKIAGRRASLASLNLCLQDLPGLKDGVLHLPSTGADTQRLALIYSGPPLEIVATRRWLRDRLDPVFVPRVFIKVDQLPRTGPGKLSRAALDEICEAHSRGGRHA